MRGANGKGCLGSVAGGVAVCRRSLLGVSVWAICWLVLSAVAVAGQETPGPTPSPSPTSYVCTGNCRSVSYYTVTIDELIVGADIALGRSALSTCRAFDANGDEAVTIEELVRAVNNALYGCGNLAPTVTPTGTPTISRTPTRSMTVKPSATPPPTPSETPTETPTATATATPTPSITLTRTVSTTPTRTPSPSLTPTVMVCDAPAASVPNVCKVQVVPVYGPALAYHCCYKVRYCLEDLEGDVNKLCIGIRTSPNLPPIPTCAGFPSPYRTINGCLETSPIQFTNPAGTYSLQIFAKDPWFTSNMVETPPFTVISGQCPNPNPLCVPLNGSSP